MKPLAEGSKFAGSEQAKGRWRHRPFLCVQKRSRYLSQAQSGPHWQFGPQRQADTEGLALQAQTGWQRQGLHWHWVVMV